MEKKFYSLTNPQKSIWYTEKYFQGTNINNICGTMTIKIPVDFEKFILAIKQFVKQNDGCRIRLSKENEESQYVAPYEDFPIEIVNVQSNREVNELTNELVGRPFGLYDTYLFQFVVFRFPDNHGGFIINMHHLISDSWTLGILVNEIISIYSSLLVGDSITKKSTDDYSYVQYILAEQEYQKSNKYEKDKQYWNDLFDTIPDIASISGSIVPSSHSNNEKGAENDIKIDNASELKAQREELSISASLLEKIKEFCTLHKISIFNFLVAIYAIYVGRVSNLDDFCFGTPILNRSNVREKNTVGMFINILPLRIHLEDHLDFQQFLTVIATNSMALLRHQKYSYQTILQDLRKKQRDLPGLYKIMISYQITKMDQEQDTIPHESTWFFNHTIADDIDIHIFDLNDANLLNIAYDYKVNQYTPDDMRKIHKRIEHIISQVLEKEKVLLSEISVVTPEEQKQLLYDFNKTSFDYPKEKTIAQLFEEQVLLTPDKTAIVFEGKSLTYAQLNEKANQLAHFLRSNGVKNNSIIGIMVGRSLEMIVSILAVLKSGGAYIPIDPDYPEDRIAYLLENSHCSIVLTQKDLFSKITISCQIVDVSLPYTEISSFSKENLPCISRSDDLSYLIYTSGSTGLPKGVMLTQKALTNLAFYCNDHILYLKNREDKAIVSVTTVSFDIFIFETLISLQRGLKLVIANHQEQTIPHCLDDLIAKENIEIIQTTPSRMQLFYNNKEDMPHLQNLKYITLAGEPLPLTLKNNLLTLTHGRIYNGYGPSETTVFSTLTDVTNQKQITIGKPLYNTQIYILDSNLQPCPIGTTGELYIAGDGVGHGYMERPDLTQKSFIPNPFIPNTIMYKTGDTGTFLPNGEILCFGRVDHQVKIRGLRIELEEIEKQIMNFPGIENCCTVKKVTEEGHEFLCSYYTEKSSISLSDLRQALQKKLPNYMIPQYFIGLEQMPYTPNGKIDKKALPEPDFEQEHLQKQVVPARNEIDSTLISVLEELCKVKNVSIQDTFYDLGGDSLSAIQLCSMLYHELNIQLSVKDILAHPVIQDLSDFISRQVKNATIQITPSEKREYYPASSAQKRVYYASEMQPDSVVYNIAGGLLLDKTPDIAKLENCLKQLINRHSSLRTYFAIEGGELVQKVLDKMNFVLETQAVNFSDREIYINNFIRPFDLQKAPLFRIKLLLFENKKSLLLIDLHHIICDGTSISILLQELCKLYNEDSLEEKTIDYKDFAIWENQNLEKGIYKEDQQYWLNQFKEEVPILDLPSSLPRSSTPSYIGDSYYISLDESYWNKILTISKEQNITPYMLLLASYFILLYKYTGQEDIVIGSPIMNRELPELDHLFGMFVNNLALRSKIDSTLSISSYLQNIKSLCLDAFKHQAYPFDELVRYLNLKREAGRNMLFDTMFIYQNNGYPNIFLKDMNASYYIPNCHISKFDLSLEVIPQDKSYSLRFEYKTDLFTQADIQHLANHYQTILKELLEDLNKTVAQVNMLNEEEQNKILSQFNNTYLPYNKEIPLLHLFEKQVEEAPEKTAIIFEDTKLSYSQLNEKVNQLANLLIQKYNVQRNQVIGILLNRSLNTVISMLAILKTGAAYLLIDESLPFDRILYMLENSKSPLLITSSNMKKIDYDHQLMLDQVNLDLFSKNNPSISTSNEDAFCVIYTSGSTGNPKGVLLKRLGIINLLLNYQKVLHTDICEHFLSMSAISFDMFIVENFIPLLSAKTVILCNEEQQKIPVYTANLIEKYQANFLLTTPTRINLLLDTVSSPSVLKSLKVIQLGGEVFSPELYEKLSQYTNANIYNGYGPSEATACCSSKHVVSTTITIGKPFYNTKLLICDKDLNLCPIGISGELCIVGDGVASGYINQKDLTNRSFVSNPYGGGILYKTGDIARFLDNGEIEYIGRKDFQIKIRGLRVELSEIEKQLLKLPYITNACAIYHSGASAYITAFYTSTSPVENSLIRQGLAKVLPLYMVPKYLVELKQFPMTLNGKVDKKALNNYDVSDSESEENYVAPQTEKQELFCKIWSQLLNRKIGIDDNIFDCGADSLLAIKFKTELLSYQIDVPYANIFQYPTIRELEVNGSSVVKQKEDFSDTINQVLENNKIQNIHRSDIQKNESNDILLLGANGFVGIHILASFLQKDSGKVYCIVRHKNGEDATVRFLRVLHFYFGTKLDAELEKRIILLPGNVLEKKLGLSDLQFEEVMNKISTIINAAAIVKHYGNEKKFQEMNVNLTQKIVDICKEYKKRFIHISSISVSGSDLLTATNQDITFSESNLYIGQDLSNVYIHSKFEAEKLILQQIPNGLNAQILRLGNMTNRFSDGKFQINPENNAFIARLKTFIDLHSMPIGFLDMPLEFTPVDICADAIVGILQNNLPTVNVFHLYNDQYVSMKQLINILGQSHIHIQAVSREEFKNQIEQVLLDNEKKEILSGIITDINSTQQLNYSSRISTTCEFTKFFLNLIDFHWNRIDDTYLQKYIHYFEEINFI